MLRLINSVRGVKTVSRHRAGRVPVTAGLLVCSAFVVQCHQSVRPSAADGALVRVEVSSGVSAITAAMSEPERLAYGDPLGFFEYCRQRYDRSIRDYRVTFTKQELVRGRLTPEQVTRVRFKEAPFSVDMVWTENAGRAGRVLFVQGRRVDKNGDELALIKPSGILGGIGIKVWRAIHGRDARREARRTIDQFGFKNTLDLIIKYARKAAAEGALQLDCVGHGRINGRPTFVFERRLPYTGQEQPYPDRLLVIHVDKEWLLPTGCFSYADDDGEQLLGRYVLTDAEFNVGYGDPDFDPRTIRF